MDKPWLKFYDPGVPPDIDIPAVPFPKILDDAADEFPERTALFFFGARIKFAALRGHANQFARALPGIGFKPGGRIGIITPNMPQAVISFFGTLKAGGTAVFFDPLSEEEELERRIKDSAVEILVVLDLILPRVDPIFAKTKVKHFIIAGVKEFLPFPRNVLFSLGAKARGINVKIARKETVHPFKDFLLGGASGQSDPEIPYRPEDAAVIQYAADTSQSSKGVLLTCKNLLANLKQISSWMGAPEKGKEVVLSVSPFHEAYGMTLAMNLPIYLAGMSIQQPKFEEAQVITAFKKTHPSLFPALPFMIQPLTNHPDFRGRPGGLKVTWSMGAPIPVEVAERYERQTGGKICDATEWRKARPSPMPIHCAARESPDLSGCPFPEPIPGSLIPQPEREICRQGNPVSLLYAGPRL